MSRSTMIVLVALAWLALAAASPSEADIKTCTDHGQSRETCIHSLYP